MPATDIDATLLSPEYVESPYRTYDLLRSQHPAYWSGFPISVVPDDPPVWKKSMVQRGLERLPLHL